MWDYFGRRGSRKGSKSTSSATEAGAQDSSSATTATGAGVKSIPPAHSLPKVKRSPAPAPVLPLGPITREEAKKWLVCRTPRPEARYRMICLAWAGGNSGIYRTWELPNVEVVAVELPGRNARMREQALKNFNQIIDRIAQAMQVQGYIKTTTTAATPQTKPLIIFGHSFGAILTVHLARTLIERGADVPHYVIVSGCSPLDVREGTPGISGMSSEEIIDYLKNMGGIPPEVAANRELMEIFLPAIKGDYTAIDNYSYTEAPPLPCPILALGGEQDDRAPPEGLAGWSRFTTKTEQFNYHIFPGGHFFIKNEGPAILALIGKHALSSSVIMIGGNYIDTR